MTDLQNELKESTSSMRILTEDRKKLKDLFNAYQTRFDKLKDQLKKMAEQINDRNNIIEKMNNVVNDQKRDLEKIKDENENLRRQADEAVTEHAGREDETEDLKKAEEKNRLLLEQYRQTNLKLTSELDKLKTVVPKKEQEANTIAQQLALANNAKRDLTALIDKLREEGIKTKKDNEKVRVIIKTARNIILIRLSKRRLQLK